MSNLTRREALTRLAWLGVAAHSSRLCAAPARRFRFGACDWSIGKMADPQAFDVARQIGLDGLQVSLGTVANDMHLRQPAIQDRYRQAVEKTGVQIASLAIGELNSVPYKRDPRTIAWVRDSVDVARALGAKVVLLAFFGEGDLKDDSAGLTEVVKRLREVAPRAEQAGVTLGIESWLSAEQSVDIISRVGSKAVRMYYDVANSEKMGYDIYQELRWLGRERICEIHLKENEALLGKGRVDFPRVRKVLDEIGYTGWFQIEGAVPPGAEMLPSYQANLAYLRRVFGEA